MKRGVTREKASRVFWSCGPAARREIYRTCTEKPTLFCWDRKAVWYTHTHYLTYGLREHWYSKSRRSVTRIRKHASTPAAPRWKINNNDNTHYFYINRKREHCNNWRILGTIPLVKSQHIFKGRHGNSLRVQGECGNKSFVRLFQIEKCIEIFYQKQFLNWARAWDLVMRIRNNLRWNAG
jgi:hypothetical protein